MSYPRLFEYYQHPSDVSGSTLALRRTLFWPRHKELTTDKARELGTEVMKQLMEIKYVPGSPIEEEYALRDASIIATQEPPLLGHQLLEFLSGAAGYAEAQRPAV